MLKLYLFDPLIGVLELGILLLKRVLLAALQIVLLLEDCYLLLALHKLLLQLGELLFPEIRVGSRVFGCLDRHRVLQHLPVISVVDEIVEVFHELAVFRRGFGLAVGGGFGGLVSEVV